MSKISDILGPQEDEQDLLPDFHSSDQDSHSSHHTTTLAYRQQRPIAVTSASNSPGSASGSASGSRTDSHSGYPSRPSSHNQNRPATHPTEEIAAEDHTGDETASSYTMDPRTVYNPNQAHQYSYPPGQSTHAAASAAARSSRGSAGGRDGYYAIDHGAVAGFDPTTMTPILHPGSTIFNTHYGSAAYGVEAAMDTDIHGIMQQQHHQSEYSSDYVGDMASYGEYQEETEMTPRTGRPSRAKKGKPVHNCLNCGRVFTRAEHLRRHQLSHEPFKYFCDYPDCNKSFSRPDLLSRHQQKHRSGDDEFSPDAGGGGRGPSNSRGPPGQMDQPLEASWAHRGAVGSTLLSCTAIVTHNTKINEPAGRRGHCQLSDAEDGDGHNGHWGYQSHTEPGNDDRRAHNGYNGYSAYQHQPVQETYTALAPTPGPVHDDKINKGRQRGESHGESSKSSTRTSNGSIGSSPSSSIPHTPHDIGIAPGHHHLSISMGHSDKDGYRYKHNDAAASYMHANTTSPLPRSVAVSHTSTGYPCRQSHTPPSMTWSSSDNTMNSALAGAFYRDRADPYMPYSISAGGSTDTGPCASPPAAGYSHATLWPPSASAMAANAPHRFVAANSNLHMQRMSSGSSSDGWTP